MTVSGRLVDEESAIGGRRRIETGRVRAAAHDSRLEEGMDFEKPLEPAFRRREEESYKRITRPGLQQGQASPFRQRSCSKVTSKRARFEVTLELSSTTQTS